MGSSCCGCDQRDDCKEPKKGEPTESCKCPKCGCDPCKCGEGDEKKDK